MATWPESNPTPNYPLRIGPRFKNLVSELDSGNEQRRNKQEFPKYDVFVNYNKPLTKTEMDVLWNFYLARKGRYEAFYIYELGDVINQTSTIFTDQYVNTANGTTATFDIPGRSTSGQTLYIDGVEDSSASFLSGGGNSNSDRVTPTSTPSAGQILTVDFTGLLRMRVRFLHDNKFNRELFVTNFYRVGGIELKGLKPAIL